MMMTVVMIKIDHCGVLNSFAFSMYRPSTGDDILGNVVNISLLILQLMGD